MPCEILFKTNVHADGSIVDYTHPDPEKDRAGVYKKGYPVAGKDIPHPGWGNKERMPWFVTVRITDATIAEVNAMMLANFGGSLFQEWKINMNWDRLGGDQVYDGHRLRITSASPGVSNLGAISRDMVINFLDRWNATVVSFDTNRVTFDSYIFADPTNVPGALQSQGFWGSNVSNIDFTENSYIAATGLHDITADYSATQATSDIIEMRVKTNNGIILDHDTINKVIRFTILRSDVSDRFKEEVRQAVEKTVYRRQFRVPTTTIDNIITLAGFDPQDLNWRYNAIGDIGGNSRYVREITFAQFQTWILNRLNE